mgnify:CR=1 FL=1
MTRPLHRPTPRPHACSSAGLRRVAAGRGGGGVSAGGLWRAICPHVRHPQRRELPALPRRVGRGAATAHLPRGPHQPWDDHVRVHRGAGVRAWPHGGAGEGGGGWGTARGDARPPPGPHPSPERATACVCCGRSARGRGTAKRPGLALRASASCVWSKRRTRLLASPSASCAMRAPTAPTAHAWARGPRAPALCLGGCHRPPARRGGLLHPTDEPGQTNTSHAPRER